MRTLKHSIQRRNHRERAQPVEREKWGLLEKPKDYRLRAQDYQSKQRRLKRLREKAAERNPDEFYFGMMREKTRNGIVCVDRGHPVLSEETVRLLKTQDAAYIKIMKRIEDEKVKKLEQHIYTSIQAASSLPRKHHYFVDETELKCQETHYQGQDDQNPMDRMQGACGNESFIYEEQDKAIHGDENNIQSTQVSIENVQSINSKLARELESRKARVAHLSILEKHIDLQRNLQTKGERKKIGISKDGIPIYRWKLERKK
ncbi:hypothetical protein PCANB_002146 [Pneumocystis canis]|nr:hypothetical protein PCK1_001965 [Pneumocystis canis]KAG5439570.1 hypothetical protein PCANB_002146 [Pneumocystis canis]